MKLIPASQANKETDIFVGMWRPPYHEILKRYERITIDRPTREKYLAGDYDEPLYQRIIDDSGIEKSKILIKEWLEHDIQDGRALQIIDEVTKWVNE